MIISIKYYTIKAVEKSLKRGVKRSLGGFSIEHSKHKAILKDYRIEKRRISKAIPSIIGCGEKAQEQHSLRREG